MGLHPTYCRFVTLQDQKPSPLTGSRLLCYNVRAEMKEDSTAKQPSDLGEKAARKRRLSALKALGTNKVEQEILRDRHERFKKTAKFRHADLGTPETKFKRKEVYGQCKRKHRYKTPQDAKITAQKVLRERGTVLHCYFCKFCNGYHLTKMQRKSGGNRAF